MQANGNEIFEGYSYHQKCRKLLSREPFGEVSRVCGTRILVRFAGLTSSQNLLDTMKFTDGHST